MGGAGGSADERVVIIGAGPAGLTAGRELARLGLPPIVVEKSAVVGGLSRTETFKGFYFDMGGHRFFTKVDEVNKIWQEVLGGQFLRRPRLSRIYYDRRFFHYPLRPLNALLGLGPRQAVLILLSYLRWQLFPHRQENTFEEWVTNRFGRRLFRLFFKTYTEKVWGIPCSELRAEWAAQRIKNLSLKAAVLSMFLKPKRTIKTLIEEFDYPRLGPGMMWNAVAAEIRQQQGEVRLQSDVVTLRRTGLRIDGIVVSTGGREELIPGTDFISSMPVSELVQKITPPPPAPVLQAARRLSYRDFLTVCLIVNRPDLFPDNWIYVHSSEVTVGRIQNFKSWSPDMVPDPSKTSLGLSISAPRAMRCGTRPTPSWSSSASGNWSTSEWSVPRTSRMVACSASPRPIRSTTPGTPTPWPRCASSWIAWRISRPSAATGCTATITRTMRC
jgi:protoporphyrinogen oxidase